MKADPLSPQAEVQTSACDLLPERGKTRGIVERTASEQNLDAAARRLKKIRRRSGVQACDGRRVDPKGAEQIVAAIHEVDWQQVGTSV